MAIIAQAAGVVLLLVALTLLSGNARAAEPSYDDYVAQVNAGKLDIDYTAFRMAYVASPKYEPYGAARLLVIQMKKAFTAGDCPAAMAHAKEIFEVNLVQIDAHYVTAVCQRKAGNEEEARREHAMLMGLVKSVLGSGDGKSPETAFVVIEEEYSVLAAFSLTLASQALVNLGGSAFDRMEVKKRDSDQTVTHAYILKKVIHDWNDEQAVRILRNCRDAMKPHGRVLVAETIIPPGNEPSTIKLIDANMLVVTGGVERTEAEYAALFTAAGLRLERVISTSQPISVLEASQL